MKKMLDVKLQEISGAFLFGIPMLYTMEMWWIGRYTSLWKLLLFLLAAYGVCILLTYFNLKDRPGRLRLSLMRAVDALAVGILVSLVVLGVLNQLNERIPLQAMVGMIVIQSVPLSIGASASHSLLSIGEARNREGDEGEQKESSVLQATLNDIGATVAGGLFISLPMAPTQEIPTLAAEMTYVHEVLLVFLTLLVTYALVFASGFNMQSEKNTGIFQRPITETVMAYIVALVIAMICLYLFNSISPAEPLQHILPQVLILGLPAAIGGAAGRLVI